MVFLRESRQRFSRMFPMLTAMLRGRTRRMRRRSQEFSISSGIESLEVRTMLDASNPSAMFVQQFVEVSISDTAESANSNQTASFESADQTQISWNQITDASGYELLIYSTTQGKEALHLDSLGTTSFQPASLNGPDSFQMFVRGFDATGQNSLWSSPVYFDVTQPTTSSIPASPNFTLATGNAIPALQWTTSVEATSYDLLIYSVSAGQEVLSQSGINTGSFEAASLAGAGDDYQAFIRASNSQGQSSSWSQPAYFTVSGESQIPQAPVLTGVTNATPPQITWNGVAGADSYEVLIYSLTQGQEVLHQTQVNSTSFTPNSLVGQTDSYQVYVRADNMQGVSGLWGGPLEFEMAAETSAFPQSPVIVTTPSTSAPVLQWSPVSFADSYEIQVYNVTAGRLVMRQSNFQQTDFDVSSLTTSPDSYQAFVRPYDAIGNPGNWSNPTDFEIVELTAEPDPVDVNPDPVDVNPDPVDVNPDPIDVTPDPIEPTDPVDPNPNPIPNPDPGEIPPGNPDDPRQAWVDAFHTSLEMFHGTDRTGKDGPTSSIGMALTLTYEEFLHAVPHSNAYIQIQNDNVLVHVDANSFDWKNGIEALGGVAEGESIEFSGDYWLPIHNLDNLAAMPWLVKAEPVLSPPTNVDWSLVLVRGTDPSQISQDVGLGAILPTGLVDDTYFFSLAGVENPSDVVAKLKAHDSVLGFDPLVSRQLFKRSSIPNDEFFSKQWYLLNSGQSFGTPGLDANVVNVWDNFRGAGVTIGIVDDGIDTTHPDLADNYDANSSFDFNFNDPDPTPFNRDSHGTSVAGIAAGRGFNGIGISGAAPQAKLAGLRLLADDVTGFQEASALGHKTQVIDISNNSWGPADVGVLSPINSLAKAALRQGVTSGRGGLGTIYTWAGGNGKEDNDNSNYDGYANSRFVTAVGAVDNNGVQSFFSEPGANLLVSAYSSSEDVGIFTTDLEGTDGASPTDYDPNFGGTSASTPLVSGVVALMLDANPNLTWRDVQHILVQSSTRVDPFDSGWTKNAAGFSHNPKYGFGAINAEAAVNLATTWVNVGPEVAGSTNEIQVQRVIPDNDTFGVISTIDVKHDINIETVEVVVNATIEERGDLQIELISPSGVSSILADARDEDDDPNIETFTFSTKRNWGENTQGKWQLIVRDLIDDNNNNNNVVSTFDSWELNFYGTGLATPPFPPGWEPGVPF